MVFFVNTDVTWYPALLNDAVMETLFGTGMVGVKFYNDLDAEDFANKHIVWRGRGSDQSSVMGPINNEETGSLMKYYMNMPINCYLCTGIIWNCKKAIPNGGDGMLSTTLILIGHQLCRKDWQG